MKRNGFLAAALAAAFVFVGTAFARSGSDDASVPFTIGLPSFDVRMSMGFNYDLLRPLTKVSFDRPVGYFGFNVPFGDGVNLLDMAGDNVMDGIFSDSGMLQRGRNFKPNAGASQNANYTVRADVPMIGGVGSFAYTQNFFFNLNTALGGSSVIKMYEVIEDETLNGFISMKGALRLPLSVSLGWETMTFGYAYRVNNEDNMVFALNLHRHLFSFDMRFRADIDLLGYAEIEGRDLEFSDGVTANLSYKDEFMNFHSGLCNGAAQGRFRAEAWTPSLAAKWERFSLSSRFGMDVKAKGGASGGFIVPRIFDIETWEVKAVDELSSISDSVKTNKMYIFELFGEGGIVSKEADSVHYEVGESMRWRMPHGLTASADIIPGRISVSYTKLFGDVNMKIDNIRRTVLSKGELEDSGSWLGEKGDNLRFDLGFNIDHVFVLEFNYPSFFANIGACRFQIWTEDKHQRSYANLGGWPKFGSDGYLLPIVSGGVNLGSKLQLRLEADILPLPAFRTGVNYFF